MNKSFVLVLIFVVFSFACLGSAEELTNITITKEAMKFDGLWKKAVENPDTVVSAKCFIKTKSVGLWEKENIVDVKEGIIFNSLLRRIETVEGVSFSRGVGFNFYLLSWLVVLGVMFFSKACSVITRDKSQYFFAIWLMGPIAAVITVCGLFFLYYSIYHYLCSLVTTLSLLAWYESVRTERDIFAFISSYVFYFSGFMLIALMYV